MSEKDSSQSQVKRIRQDDLKEIILQHQNKYEKGYYTYDDWSQLHYHLLAIDKNTMPVVNGWRLLKLINFGDDYVPTGLIFDTLVTLLDVDRSIEENESLIKSIFFKFIEFNGKFLSEKEREELAFFSKIKSVAQGYKKLLMGDHDLNKSDQRDRNHQLHRLHEARVYKKNLQTIKKIQQEFKQCKFQPEINPKSELIQSRYLEPKPSPIKTQDLAENMIIYEEQEYSQGFRAQPVPVYPEIVPSGLNQHTARMQKSRQIKRINSLKPYKGVGSNEIEPFTLDERQYARKQRLVNNYKLLFIIKAEVGKRIYRIKVRQNMNVEDVVRAIWLMVGFKDQSLQQIVKQYFVTWQNRSRDQKISVFQ